MSEPIPFQVPVRSPFEALSEEYAELEREYQHLEAAYALAVLRGVAIGVLGSILSSAVLIWLSWWAIR